MVRVKEMKMKSDTRRVVFCPHCGHPHVFFFEGPDHCDRCNKEVPDVIEMLNGRYSTAKKLEYYVTGRTGKYYETGKLRRFGK